MDRDWLFVIVILATALGATPAAAQDSPAEASSDAPKWLAKERFSLGVPLEATVVGFSAGLRPELLYRPFSPDGSAHVRLAVGIMPGLEFLFVPVDVGWRQIFRRGEVFQPLVGAGYEHQFFVVPDWETIDRGVFYLEGGADVRVSARSHVGAHLAVDAGVFSRPGFGMSGRVNYRYDF